MRKIGVAPRPSKPGMFCFIKEDKIYEMERLGGRKFGKPRMLGHAPPASRPKMFRFIKDGFVWEMEPGGGKKKSKKK